MRRGCLLLSWLAVTACTGSDAAHGTSPDGGLRGTGGASGALGAGGLAGGSGSGATSGTGASGGASGASGGASGSAGASGASGGGGASGASGGGGSGAAGAAGAGGAGAGSCLGSALLSALGQTHVIVGAAMSDATAKAAPFGLRYTYLSGGLFDGASPCTRCDVGCTSNGRGCQNLLPDGGPNGCSWWGCWQYDQDPPGAYARDFFATAKKNHEVPMISWYEELQASHAGEGTPEVTATTDAAFMGRYLAAFRFLVDQIGQATVLVHIEPDFWGYAEHVNQDPHAIPAAVASASAECTGFEDSIAGLGRCMIAMVHAHAPNAKVGLHGSGWGTNIDVLENTQKTFDVAAQAQKLGTFLYECGPDADVVVVDASDRDAGFYQSQGKNTWWDATNATLPNFHQAFAWAKALAEQMQKPIVWWQLPVGNSTLGNVTNAWKDDRVDYFLDHMDEVAAAHGVAIAFGAGDGAQTTPESDGGHLVARVKAYAAAGGQPFCP